MIDGYDWNGNGSSLGYSGSVEGSNGSLKGVLNGNGASNGSLVKYVNGNGAAVKTAEVDSVGKQEEVKRKKTVEEIGQEEAWFKRGGKEKPEVIITSLLFVTVFSVLLKQVV